jgi:hypothetical protein
MGCSAGGPALDLVDTTKMWVPRPCVFVQGPALIAVEGAGTMLPVSMASNPGSFESFEQNDSRLAVQVPALRNVREGRGTRSSGSFGNSKAGPPAVNSPWYRQHRTRPCKKRKSLP